MSEHSRSFKLFGFCFIFAFLSYGIGASLIESITSVPNFLLNVSLNQEKIIIGCVLMGVVHTLCNIALPVLMYPILIGENKVLMPGYFGLAITATTVLVIGAILNLLLVPLSTEVAANHYMGFVLKKGSFYSYHIGMALWSLGGVLFVLSLYKSKLITKLMSYWGVLGYIILFFGSISELFIQNEAIEIMSVIPGGLFEICLSLIFIFKGGVQKLK